MTIHHQSLRRLLYFQQVVEAGTFRAAAAILQVSTPVVSAALADLEAQLNVTLLVRSTRSLELTEAGRAVYESASRMIHHASEAMERVEFGADLAGAVSLTVPSEVAVEWMPPVLEDFARAYPNIKTYINASDDVEDMRAGGYDIALRTRFFLHPPARDLLPPETVALLPLALVTRDPVVIEADDDGANRIVHAPLLGSEYLQINGIDARHRKTGSVTKFMTQKGFTISSRQAALELSRKGMGIALLTLSNVQEHLDRGELAHVAEDYSVGSIAVFMVFRDGYPSSCVRAFAALARQHAKI